MNVQLLKSLVHYWWEISIQSHLGKASENTSYEYHFTDLSEWEKWLSYLTLSDNSVAFKRIANSPIVWFYFNAFLELLLDPTLEEIQLGHMIIVTTKGRRRKQPIFFKLSNKVFCISTKKFQTKFAKKIVYWVLSNSWWSSKRNRSSNDLFQVMHSITELKNSDWKKYQNFYFFYYYCCFRFLFYSR